MLDIATLLEGLPPKSAEEAQLKIAEAAQKLIACGMSRVEVRQMIVHLVTGCGMYLSDS